MAKRPTDTFTEDTITAAKPRDKAFDIRDRGGKSSVPGLLLRVYPSGKKSYYVQVKRGVRVVLGDAATTTLKRARELAKAKTGRAAGREARR